MSKSKIKVANPIVYFDGDEMGKVLFDEIMKALVDPFVEIPWARFDLSVENRNATGDAVTKEGAEALKIHRVGLKAATITPSVEQKASWGLTHDLKSPNGTLRNATDGTIFRFPITSDSVVPRARFVTKPVVVARHAFGDEYAAQEIRADRAGTAKLIFVPADGSAPTEKVIREFKEPGVIKGIFNLDASITGFARNVFSYALDRGLPVFLTTKETISKIYGRQWKMIFAEIFKSEFASKFEAKGLTYEHLLIDTMAERILKGPGGFVWACLNYDGDVQSDSVGGMFGSNGMMASFLRSVDGSIVCAEAAHGTVTRHYKLWKEGKPTSTNPVASIAAFVFALQYRGQFDNNAELVRFSELMREACVATLDAGTVTGDILDCVKPGVPARRVSFIEFLTLVQKRLTESLG